MPEEDALPHDTPLLAYVTAGLVLALVAGLVSSRLRIPPIVGYILAGIVVGPATPGFTADQELATELAELGVILLMFGVGIHFSFRDLLQVKSIAIPGAAGQIAVASACGFGLAMLWGWTIVQGILFGLALSVASTVVLLRALANEGALESIHGRVAVGWLIVEDLAMVVVLVLVPVMATIEGTSANSAQGGEALKEVALVVAKVTLFIAIIAIAGVRVVPKLMSHIARTGSRELFTLGVLAIALGIAYTSAQWFEVSMALGAFLAGIVVGESEQSHQAAADALPFRDAFAVLFFVSVGMLFDPGTVLERPLHVVAALAVVILIKPVVAYFIVLLLGHPPRTGLTVGAGLGQIGEFSFILVALGEQFGVMNGEGGDLILAVAILSIAANSLLFQCVDPLDRWVRTRPGVQRFASRRARELTALKGEHDDLKGHTILCGYGRVGSVVGDALEKRGFRYAVVELNQRAVERLRQRGVPAIYGDLANDEVLERLHVEHARVLVIAVPDPHAAARAAARARAINPQIHIVARTHSDFEWQHLREGAVDEAVLGERELAIELTRYTLQRYGVSALQAASIAQGLRQRR